MIRSGPSRLSRKPSSCRPPESELASLGLFHTLMETGDKQGAIKELNRFCRVADSKEYDAIAKKYGLTVPKTRSVYVDNFSVFIEGQRASAVSKGMAIDINDAIRRGVFDFTWRLDFGKLHRVLLGKKNEVGRATFWSHAASELRDAAQFVPLDRWLAELSN